jgi:DNA-binding HxlR family transcriptional regulator
MGSSQHRRGTRRSQRSGLRSQESGLHGVLDGRDTAIIRTYGQYCPIARGAEIFAERWTPLIIRNVHLGCATFGEILEGAPGLSRTLLAQRLKQLERLGIVESVPKAQGRGHRYQLTSSGHDLFQVCQTLGEWGARWLEIAPENLDPFVALWSMCNALRRDRLPDRRVVIRLDFTGFRPHERYWLLLERGEAELCKTYPGLDEDLYMTADAEAFVKWHARGPALVGGGNPRRPDPARRSLMARTGVPDLEQPQHVRSRQARNRGRARLKNPSLVDEFVQVLRAVAADVDSSDDRRNATGPRRMEPVALHGR